MSARQDSSRASPERSEGHIEVVAAVIERGGRILIARRHVGSHLGGLWEFPGGKRQAGETAEAALVREIREELDAAVSVGELLDDVEWRYPEKTVRLALLPLHPRGGAARRARARRSPGWRRRSWAATSSRPQTQGLVARLRRR